MTAMGKNIAVLVSGGGTNLQALIDAQARGEIVNGQITAVISSRPDAYALERARAAGIPGYVVARKDYPSSQAMTVALTEKLQALHIDLVDAARLIPDYHRLSQAERERLAQNMEKR